MGDIYCCRMDIQKRWIFLFQVKSSYEEIVLFMGGSRSTRIRVIWLALHLALRVC